MDQATGAMGALLPKLVKLLSDEYKLPKSVKEGVNSLEKEMQIMHAALRQVAEVPRDQLHELVKLWAGEVRELSFNMEDVVDKFLVRVDNHSETSTKSNKLKRLTEKMTGLFTKGKARHEIANAIKDINKQVRDAASRRERYNVDNIVAMSRSKENIVAVPLPVTIDPRLKALYTEVTELVGIAGKRDEELMKLLSEGDNDTKSKLKIVSIVGFGGLGKTTLVKTVYEKIKEDFDCTAFVPVGRNADAKKVFTDILLDLGKNESHFNILDERQLIDKLRESLKNKRYLIVIDDVWDEKLWEIINLAFSSSNNFGSRIITTTRKVTVSELCCSSTNDSVYQMEPLSDDDSKRLFYKRIFSCEGGCPPEFQEVSINILKKCGGVPLAIITLSSLLATDQHVKSADEWHVLLKSIGCGLKENPRVDEMLRILSFSYYDLPSHLKTCLLYLGMFPEDCEIEKDQLIWMWIAERFVQFEKEKTSLFEIGENYFNELVNRNMIMPVYADYNGSPIFACRVHDMVLDLILSLSSEDNFVTVLNGTGTSMTSSSNVRRLSLQNARNGELQTTPLESASMLQVRSVVVFGHGIDFIPSFSSFGVLRVLDLSGCDLRDDSNLKIRDLGSMLHLRYLSLAYTGISKVPKEVGKLQFLQLLNLLGNYSVELPSTIIKLTRLMCLLIDIGSGHKRVPDGFGNMPSMEVLCGICCDSLSIVKEIGGMERLRELDIKFDNWSLQLEEAFVESLGKLSNIQRLAIRVDRPSMVGMNLLGDCWMPPRSLREFTGSYFIYFSTLPAWIRRDPSHLSQLSKLNISVGDVRQEYLDSLGKLSALRTLSLESISWRGLLLVGIDRFRCLIEFKLHSNGPELIMFQPGAMPRAKIVDLRTGIPFRVEHEEAVCDGLYCYDLGMRNLPSLRRVNAILHRYGVTGGKAKQAEAALVSALHAHPNHPASSISFYPYMSKDEAPDDKKCWAV